jgi:hypothetical protein
MNFSFSFSLYKHHNMRVYEKNQHSCIPSANGFNSNSGTANVGHVGIKSTGSVLLYSGGMHQGARRYYGSRLSAS